MQLPRISHRLVRFVISGGSAAFVLLCTLFVLHDLLGLWYLAASAIAFSIAVIVSFILQKFWTFENTETHIVHKQFILFVCVAFFNLGANTVLMYTFVDIVGVWYLFAQVMTALTIAIWSFFLYRAYIFKPTTTSVV